MVNIHARFWFAQHCPAWNGMWTWLIQTYTNGSVLKFSDAVQSMELLEFQSQQKLAVRTANDQWSGSRF